MGYVAVPHFSRSVHGMCGSATVFAQGTWDAWQFHSSCASYAGEILARD